MHRRPQPTTLVTLSFTLALALGAMPARAEEPAKGLPLLAPADGTIPAFTTSRPLFRVAPVLEAAAAQASTATVVPLDHQFGVGVHLGGVSGGIGGGVRYFFYAGPLGVQAEVWRHAFDLGQRDFDSVQFVPSAIYRFQEFRFEAPVSLVPYAGIGLSFIHSSFDEDLFPGLTADDTDVGVLLYGGVELFFERVPHLGASGEIRYDSNDEITSGGFGTDLGGASFVAAAHWYFW